MPHARKPTGAIYESDQAADLIGRSRRQLDRIRNAGDIGFIREGRRIFYRQQHIDDYLAKRDGTVPPAG